MPTMDATLLEHPAKNENGWNGNSDGSNDNNNSSVLSSINNNPLSKTIMLGGDFEFLRLLSLNELKARMANLDLEMEAEIEELRRRYAAKRQPILDTMDQKKKRQQNF